MDARAKEILTQGNKLFSNKQNIDSLWQEIALNFYPERADFTDVRVPGEEFSDHLFTSFPSMARRELANMVATSLRPRAQKWFSIHASNEISDSSDNARSYLEYLTNVQWRAMYQPRSGLIRATKQADHDFVAFGNAVIYVGPNNDADGLIYKNYHLRDCAWAENADGKIDTLFRKWKTSAKKIYEAFPKTVSADIKKAYTKDPYSEFKCWHVVVPAAMWGGKSKKEGFDFVSVFIEEASETILEEIPLRIFPYIVPRWHTLDCSAYATSMATSICLPDGRTAQVVARTMLEAGEKYVDPPMIAFSDAIRGDIALYAGGITIADHEYDEKTGEVLRPISQNSSGYPIADSISAALREDISNGFFLNKIQLPDTPGDMTAYETRQRIQEYIRAAAPIFEPIEQEYNDPLCQVTFEYLMQSGAFPMDQMPEELQGNEINFSFRSPMADMAEQQDAEIFVDAFTRILSPAAQADQSQLQQVNWDVAVRDAMKATGFKQKWFKPLEEIQAAREAAAEQAARMQEMQEMAMAGEAGQQAAQGEAALRSVAE